MNSITTRVWIAGASGRLGSALSHRFGGNTAYKLVTSDRDVAVEDVSVVGRFADINHPDVIINCAGLTDVQACEANPEEAYKINAIGARNLATAARRIDAKFIQISTDDVFGGDEDKAFCEFDDPHPTTMYGKSKYAGEKLVRELTDNIKNAVYQHVLHKIHISREHVERNADDCTGDQRDEDPCSQTDFLFLFYFIHLFTPVCRWDMYSLSASCQSGI